MIVFNIVICLQCLFKLIVTTFDRSDYFSSKEQLNSVRPKGLPCKRIEKLWFYEH